MSRGLLFSDRKVFYMCAGYIGNSCQLLSATTPHIVDFVHANVCVVEGDRRCDEVFIAAFFFAVNPMFACKVVVSILLSVLSSYLVGLHKSGSGLKSGYIPYFSTQIRTVVTETYCCMTWK